jgi:hypothetical protein
VNALAEDTQTASELVVEFPTPAAPEDRYVNTRGATLNYVVWNRAREVYCADKNSPGDL